MLEGKNILIVEDEPLIALDLETAIQDARGQVIGAMGSVRTALQAVETLTFDGAILDLRLNGEDALPVMQALSNRKIPFVIHSGQADRTVTTDWPIPNSEFKTTAVLSKAEHHYVIAALTVNPRTGKGSSQKIGG